jgi:hypothetical protein
MKALMARSNKQQKEKNGMGMTVFAASPPGREVESKFVMDGRRLHAPGALKHAPDILAIPNPVMEVRP